MAHEQSTENLSHLMPACLDYRDIPKKNDNWIAVAKCATCTLENGQLF